MQRLLRWLAALPKRQALALAGALLALALAASYPWVQAHGQKAVWQAPFLSAAANLRWGGDFWVDNAQMLDFDAGDDLARQDAYRFAPAPPGRAVWYPANEIGYVYWVWLAKHLFPFLGDQAAIRLLQALVHIGLCLAVMSLAGMRGWRRWGFLALYGLNPLVLRFVTFNHYYFWQCLPAFALVFLLALRGRHRGAGVYIALALGGMVLGLCWLIRPTLVGLLAVVGALALWQAYRDRLPWAGVGLGLTLGAGFLYSLLPPRPSQKIVWHSAYMGVGAYDNPFGVYLSDNASYALYKRQTGITLNGSVGGNLFDSTERARFKGVLEQEYKRIAAEAPGLVVYNTLRNGLQGLGIGYLGSRWWLGAALLGLAVAAYGFWRRRWWLLAGLAANAATVSVLFPPIPAYVLGGYVLLAALFTLRPGPVEG